MDTCIDTVTELEDGGVLVGLPYQAQVVEKGWGAEHILGPSTGYLFKKLFMREGCRCSLQLHNFKEETILVITGQLKVTVRVSEPDYIDTEFILGPGDYFHLSPRTIHRMEALENCYYVEASTNHPDDVVRLHTDYPEPEESHLDLVDGDSDFIGMGTVGIVPPDDLNFDSVASVLNGKRMWTGTWIESGSESDTSSPEYLVDPWLPVRDIDPFDPDGTITLPKDRSGICGNGSRLTTPEEAAKAKANPNTKWIGKKHTDLSIEKQSISHSKEYDFTNPYGDTIHVHNLKKFCLFNDLCVTSMRNLSVGKIKEYKGWRN